MKTNVKITKVLWRGLRKEIFINSKTFDFFYNIYPNDCLMPIELKTERSCLGDLLFVYTDVLLLNTLSNSQHGY